MTIDDMPRWFNDIANLYQSNTAHAFSVTGNVTDYVITDQPAGQAVTFLATIFSKRDVVVVYDRSGFTFPIAGAEHEKRFRQIVEMDTGDGTPDPLMAMLGQPEMASMEADEPELPTQPKGAIPLLDQLLKSKSNVMVIIDMAQTIFPAAQISQMSAEDRDLLVTVTKWATDSQIETRGSVITLLSDGDLHPMITKAWRPITIPLPGREERATFVEWYMGSAEFDSVLDNEQIANLTAGLNLRMIEDIFLMASLSGTLDRQALVDRKKALVAQEYGDVIEIIDPQYGFEGIGGLGWIKTYFRETIVQPMIDGELDIVPMGVLMPGPPGTGKSAFAIACAREANMLVFKLNLGGQIASKWQGEGERNLRRAFDAFDGAGQCIVFVDEIDNAFSRGGQGSGGNQQEARIFQMLLEYMSDTTHRGKVVFLAATNRPDNIDPAVIRSGRFDDIIPFPIPDDEGRRAIFAVMAKRFGLVREETVNVPEAAIVLTKDWSGAEIEAASMKAKRLMRKLDGYEKAIIAAVRSVRSRTSKNAAQMQRLAFDYASDLDFLPPSERENYGNEMTLSPSVPAPELEDAVEPRSSRERREI